MDFWRFIHWLDNWLINFFHDPETNPLDLPMNQETPFIAPVTPTPPKYLWDTKANVKHSVRVICDEEGLSLQQKNELCATVWCESGLNPKCVHPNVVNGKVTSTDYGICQVNDYWHIGAGKDFPSSDYVLNNPEACIRWMCKLWKAGQGKLWVCYLRNMYKSYL